MERKVFGILKPPRMVGWRGTLPGSLLTRKPNRKPSAACRLHSVFTGEKSMQVNVAQREAESWQADTQLRLIVKKLKWARDSTLLVACGTGPIAQRPGRAII
jgi:hypothetical protein